MLGLENIPATAPVRRRAGQVVECAAAIFRRLLSLEVIDRSLVIGAQAFSALIPLLIVFASVGFRNGRTFADDLVNTFQLSGRGADAVRSVLTAPGDGPGSTVAGLLLVVFSSLSFTRALQRTYELAWGLRRRGVKGSPWGLLWLALFALYWWLAPTGRRSPHGQDAAAGVGQRLVPALAHHAVRAAGASNRVAAARAPGRPHGDRHDRARAGRGAVHPARDEYGRGRVRWHRLRVHPALAALGRRVRARGRGGSRLVRVPARRAGVSGDLARVTGPRRVASRPLPAALAAALAGLLLAVAGVLFYLQAEVVDSRSFSGRLVSSLDDPSVRAVVTDRVVDGW